MTLFNDPLRWSKAAVGSEWGLGLLIGVHLVMCGVTAKVLFTFDLAFLLVPILMVGIVMPFMYLYALRKLLRLIEGKYPKSTPQG